MVRATIIVSALFALAASVSAVPHGSLVGLKAKYIGTGDIDLEDALSHAVSLDNLEINDVGQDIDIARGGLLKRKAAVAAAAADTVKVVKKAGIKGNKKMARKAAKNAQKI